MRNRMTAVVLAAFMTLAASSASAADVIVHVPGYSYAAFVTTSAVGVDDLELDAAGNVYQVASGDMRRITPAGAASPWSSATADDIVFAGTGEAYGAGRAVCHCIVSIDPSGGFSTLHTDSQEWTYVTLGSDGTLYSNIWAGPGQGLYNIDRSSGTPTPIVSGGPGLGGTGFYAGMLIGQDGKLYAGGGSSGTFGLFRLEGNQFTKVASWPHGSYQLAQDNQGIFYTSVTVELPPLGTTGHEVWMIDPSSGTPTLVADGPGSSSGVAYDRARNLLYVENGGDIYIIAKSATPTRRETWSAVKAKFR